MTITADTLREWYPDAAAQFDSLTKHSRLVEALEDYIQLLTVKRDTLARDGSNHDFLGTWGARIMNRRAEDLTQVIDDLHAIIDARVPATLQGPPCLSEHDACKNRKQCKAKLKWSRDCMAHPYDLAKDCAMLTERT